MLHSRVDPALYRTMLETAVAEARLGLAEGGVPVGAAIFHPDGRLLSSGRNRRVQQGDPSLHGETDAFRRAGRQRSYRDLILVTTLARAGIAAASSASSASKPSSWASPRPFPAGSSGCAHPASTSSTLPRLTASPS